MRKKLLLLNLLLTAMLAAAGVKIRDQWLESRRREAELLAIQVPPTPTPPVPVSELVQPMQAAGYLDVAAKMLFSKDRNPMVVVEAPQPKPDPEMPVVHGVMDLGFGATVFMTEKAGGQQKGYKTGDKVGEYKLVKASRTDLEFEWDGKTFRKTVTELKAKPSMAPPPQQAASGAGTPATPVTQQPTNYTVTSEEKMKELQKPKAGAAWIDTGGVNHACAPGDSAPAGTVTNGYRKVLKPSMFGQICFWEPVSQ